MPIGEFVAFDLETTGLSPKTDRVLEIGAVRFDASMRRLAEMQLVVDPGVPIPIAVQRLCGISEADVAGAAQPVEGVAQLADFCDGAQLVAHGAQFDMAFCAGLAPGAFANRRVLDTLELARIVLPAAASHSLPLLSAALHLRHERPHRALSDATATHELFGHLVERAAALPAATLAEVRRVASAAPDEAAFFGTVVRGEGDPAARAWAGAPSVRPSVARTSEPVADVVAATVSALARLGAEDGEPALEAREEQQQMARAVAQTLQRRRRLLVEAGTGVGKSLAYLLPVALHSRSGRRSVVATYTTTLQEQLRDRDLPLVERLIGAPVAAAVLKGRNHQLSLRRWHRFLRAPDAGSHGADLERVRFKLKILVWLGGTATGDRDELHLSGGELALWRHVESDAADCLGSACANWQSGRCFMVAARRDAEQADVVITNHSLLLADAAGGGQVLGAYDTLVVDEAHHLEAAATAQLGAGLRAADVHLTLERLGPASGDLGAALGAARDAASRLFGDVKGRIGEILGSDHSGNVTVGLSAETTADRAHSALVRTAETAVLRWRTAAAALREPGAGRLLEPELLPQHDRAGEERFLAAAALEDAAAVVERVLLRPRAGHVAWLALRAEQAEVHEAPVTVVTALREGLYDRVDAVVATSATLSVAGDFAFVRDRLGLDGAEELLLDSPYDYLAHALCVLADGIPPYGDEAYDAALAGVVGDVAERLGGSTLALFTGYAPLRRVHALLARRLAQRGIALLGQGLDGTRRQILESFLANQRTVLLGTSSFWEGVDVPGDALRCVVIAKLPFAVPTDPLVRARTDGLGDPFSQYVLPQAVLRLRQGFGRLIRGGADHGAVVLCDERLGTRDYGSRFLDALPPTHVARVPARQVGEVVAGFVAERRPPDPAWRGRPPRQSRQQPFAQPPDEEPA